MTGLGLFLFGDGAIVGLQTVSSIDFLSDAMKPGVLWRWEGGRGHGIYCTAHQRGKLQKRKSLALTER